MTVIDSSGVVDYLLGTGAAEQVRGLMRSEGQLAAPAVVVFEVMAVLRREALRGTLAGPRATGAVADLADVQLALFPSLPLRWRAWELRENFTIADALFVTLAEQLQEPLATKDESLAHEIAKHTDVEVLRLGDGA